MRSFVAVLVAGFASSLYVLSTALQALEARKTSPLLALQTDLLAGLVRRRIWLAGAAMGLIAWPLQAVALALASVALVQPALGLGLIVLLAVGGRLLGERVGRREIIGVITIGSGLALVGWFAPSHTGVFTRRGSEILIGLLVVIVGAPYVLRVLGRAGGFATSLLAGLGWAWVWGWDGAPRRRDRRPSLVRRYRLGCLRGFGQLGCTPDRNDGATDVAGDPRDPSRIRT
jgi:hypothetical protein